jgi:hypothetical protein
MVLVKDWEHAAFSSTITNSADWSWSPSSFLTRQSQISERDLRARSPERPTALLRIKRRDNKFRSANHTVYLWPPRRHGTAVGSQLTLSAVTESPHEHLQYLIHVPLENIGEHAMGDRRVDQRVGRVGAETDW